jgi:hypothetical protein
VRYNRKLLVGEGIRGMLDDNSRLFIRMEVPFDEIVAGVEVKSSLDLWKPFFSLCSYFLQLLR